MAKSVWICRYCLQEIPDKRVNAKETIVGQCDCPQAVLKRIADYECMCCAGDCSCGGRFQEWAREAMKTQTSAQGDGAGE